MRPFVKAALAAGLFLLALMPAAVFAAPAAGRAGAGGSGPPQADSLALKEWSWRSVGPANMGGRVSTFAVSEKHPATFFVGTGTGGVFKTTNLGTTWSPVFD